MITLPLSYGIARVISQGLGGATWTIWLAALVVSFLVYLVDWYAQTDWTRKDYYGRLIYVVLNTFIVVGILTGLITLGEAP